MHQMIGNVANGGDSTGSLYDVESSNIWPFAPSVEEWSDPVSGELATTE